MNRLSLAPLVEKSTGGMRGGCSRLTEEGRKAIIQYKELREKFLEFTRKVRNK
jgi:molybdate transport repressor ModE-like protein